MLPSEHWNLDRPVLKLPNDEFLTLRDLVESVMITGSAGSGKSSSSFRTLVQALLQDIDAGGIFFTAKPGDADVYRSWCEAAGRGQDVIVLSPESSHRFDVFRYLHLTSREDVENYVGLLMELMRVLEKGEKHSGGDAFWDREVKKTLRMATSGLLLANRAPSLTSLEQMIITAPQSQQQVHSPSWVKSSYLSLCMDAAMRRSDAGLSDARETERVATFFMRQWPGLAEKTRSIVEASITGITSVFLQKGILRDLFASESLTLVPNIVEHGGVLIIDLPSLEDSVGMLAQILLKFVFQRAMLKRLRRKTDEPHRPIFFALDEAQTLLTEDHRFLQVSRAAACISIMATQNLSGLEDALGGDRQAETSVHNLLGNCGVVIGHAQSEKRTQEWLAGLCGRDSQWRGNFNSGESMEGSEHFGAGSSEHIDYNVQPSDFAKLRRGGPLNNFECDAYVIAAKFAASGRPYRKVAFSQK